MIVWQVKRREEAGAEVGEPELTGPAAILLEHIRPEIFQARDFFSCYLFSLLCYYHQGLHNLWLQPGSHPEPSVPPVQPAYSFRCGGLESPALTERRGRTRKLWRHPFSGLYEFYFTIIIMMKIICKHFVLYLTSTNSLPACPVPISSFDRWVVAHSLAYSDFHGHRL